MKRILALWKSRSNRDAEGSDSVTSTPTAGPLEDLTFVTGTGSATKPPSAPAAAATADAWAADWINDDSSSSSSSSINTDGDGRGGIIIDVTNPDDISMTNTTTTTTTSVAVTAGASPVSVGGAGPMPRAAGTAEATGQADRGGWRVARYSDRTFSLGKLLVEHLRTAFKPPLRAAPGEFMAGCLVVKAENLEKWAAAQEGGEL